MKINGLSVVIPVYNEEKTLEKVVLAIKGVLDKERVNYEIICVDDASRDKSYEILKKLKFVKTLKHPINKGYSTALKTGIKNSKYDWILITDSDGTYPGDAIPSLLKYLPEYDMVVGARTGNEVNIPLFRKPAKFIIGKVANYLSGYKIPDVNSGLRIFNKEIAMNFYHLYPQRFSFTITITLAFLTNGYNVKYIPINYYKREEKSTIHPVKDFVKFITIIMRIVSNFNPMKIFSLISFFLVFCALIIFLYSVLYLNAVKLDVTIIVLVLAAIQIFLFGIIADLIAKNNNRLK